MYPTITPGSGGPPFTPPRYQPPPPQPQQSSAQHSSPFPVAQPQSASSPFPVYGNGPSAAPGSPNSAFPLLRVHIAEPYRTDPPVLVGSGEANIERSQFTFDFDLERRMLAEGQQSSRAGYSGQVPDPCQASLQQYTAQGLNAEAVSMAFIAMKGQLQDGSVQRFCESYQQLKSMGFPAELIAGSLISQEGDLQAATDACLAHC